MNLPPGINLPMASLYPTGDGEFLKFFAARAYTRRILDTKDGSLEKRR
jgi:hypothetical protein